MGYGETLVKNPVDAFDTLSLKLHVHKWRIANAKSRVDVGDGLRDCRTENIHTRHTIVIAFSYVAVGLWLDKISSSYMLLA